MRYKELFEKKKRKKRKKKQPMFYGWWPSIMSDENSDSGDGGSE